MIFRGPMRLKQFAVYTPGSSAKKSKKQGGHHGKKHNHAHVHKREDAPGYGVPAIVAGETTSSKSGAWTRSGYYNAEQSISEGLSFLNPKFIWEE